eukprot:CAMPEP_0119546180 /NCGR_PEP_ID=MMETSP1352-20130426/703_1 /TAXON_ID=265584 /ORGANISM="Stauroneis constricta, Strain CCMP1120" /LENGTH=357 /DNA_ID=CAMNT_0007590847 /DNA_START=123 /DNA_END=1196 /DNA_ORIENTATION=-
MMSNHHGSLQGMIQQSIELNNDGVHALNVERYSTAVQTFSRALAISRQALASIDANLSSATTADARIPQRTIATNHLFFFATSPSSLSSIQSTDGDDQQLHHQHENEVEEAWGGETNIVAVSTAAADTERNPQTAAETGHSEKRKGGRGAARPAGARFFGGGDDDDEETEEDTMAWQEMYRTPLVISREEQRTIECCYESCLAISALIIFNLAMVHQLDALNSSSCSTTLTKIMDVAEDRFPGANNNGSSSDSTDKKLMKAARLYELALSVFEDQCLENNAYFILAMLNNLGIANAQLRRQQASVACFENLFTTLLLLGDDDASASEHQPFAFEIFRRNAIRRICGGGNSNVTAAAA